MNEVKPAKGFVVLAAVVLALAVVLLAVSIVGLVGNTSGGQSLLNGEIVTVDKQGNYEVCVEYIGAMPALDNPQFVFIDESGAEFWSQRPGYSSTYTVGNTSGLVIAVVELPPATYTVLVDARADLDYILRRGSFGGMFFSIFGMVGGILLGIFSTIALVILVAVRKSNKLKL